MASIVYNGVAGGGDLFQGQKFFIIQRVPARNELVKNIERNGGVVVPIEKNADVMIADHAKPKLAPPNSVSWTYLEQSIKKGQLEDLESHRIGSPRKTGLPMKLTRTPYTREDDMAISIWVAKAEKLGLPVRGNEIYEQFADKNPRHTAQSWRDRWIKQLSSQPRPEIDMDSTDWPVKNKEDRMRRTVPPATQSKNAPTAPSSSGAGKRHVPAGSSAPVTPYTPQDENPFKEEDLLTKRATFTKEDDELLEKEHLSIMDIAPGSEVFAWGAFAQAYPKHSAGDWCNYYHRIFKQKLKMKEGGGKDATKIKPKSNQGQDSASKACTTPVRAAAPSRSGTESRDPTRRPKLREDKAIASSSLRSETPDDQPPINPAAKKAKFIGNWGFFLSSINRVFEHTFDLDGRKLELYDLWSAVNKPEFGGFKKVEEANRWLQVATKLDINTYRHDRAHTALRQVYRDKLVDFDAYLSGRNREAKRRTSPTSTGPVTPVTAIPTQVAEESRADSSLRKDAKEHVPLSKSTGPVTPVAAIRKQTPEQTHMLSSGVSTPNSVRPTMDLPRELANKDVATQRIRQSLGRGELAFLQSVTEFARKLDFDPVIFEPIVSKRKIGLFNIWTNSLPLLGHFDEIEGREVWDDLATKLKFDVSAHPNAGNELKQICKGLLVDFYEYFVLVEQEKVRQKALRQQPEDEGQLEEEAMDDSDDNLESPPLAFQIVVPERRKRSHDEDISPAVESRPTSSQSHNKRPRISKGKERADEIPSTPEHVYNNHLSSDENKSGDQNSNNRKLFQTDIEYFPPPSPSEELDSSPSRQLWSEAIGYTPPSQNNNYEEATQSQTDSQDNNEKIKKFVELSEARGFDIEIIKLMLAITTMNAELTESLLSDYANGLKIPENVAGIWTETDDNGVKSHAQSGSYRRVLKKHGEIRCLERKDFLRCYEEEQSDLEVSQMENA